MEKARIPRDVDDYLRGVSPQARIALEKLRKTIRAAAPKATETIGYHIPIFKYQGPLVGFAAFKNHCSFFPMSARVMVAHRRELQGYETSKGTIRFAADQPLPATLVRKLVRARLEENEARKTKPSKKRRNA
jgi:uncharacterized protein YdhG (YjbR/CyaY superfamily)